MKKSTKIFTILAILLLAALLTVTASAEELPAADTDLILHKNFEVLTEQGTPEDLRYIWEKYEGHFFLESDPANVAEGAYAVKFIGGVQMEAFGYSATVEADSFYEFSFQVKGTLQNSDHVASEVSIDFLEAAYQEADIREDVWTTVRCTFKAVDTVFVTFYIHVPQSEGSVIYLDDIQLRKIASTDAPLLVTDVRTGTSPDDLTGWYDYQSSFRAADNDSSIRYVQLQKDLADQEAWMTGGCYTFDLNGHRLSSKFYTSIWRDANVTIVDSVGNGLFSSNCPSGLLFENQGTLTIQSGTFHGIIYNNKGTVTITGGRFSEDPSAYVAEGYEVVEDAETGYYVVQKQVAIGPVITVQPIDYSGSVNDTVEFSVAAEGEGLRYEWFYSNNGGESWQKSYSSGYNTATLRVALRAHRDGQQYRCKITDADGNTVFSNAAVMSVRASEVIITSQPAAIENGIVNQLYTVSVAAEGDNLTYRWQFSNDGGETWQNSWNTGYNTETVQVRLYAYRNGYQYRCLVTSGLKNTVITEPAQLNLQKASAQVVSQSSHVTAAVGELVEFSVEACGTDLQYAWYRSNDQGATWIKTYLSGFSTDTLSFVANKNREAIFRCMVTDGSGSFIWSSPAKLTVVP